MTGWQQSARLNAVKWRSVWLPDLGAPLLLLQQVPAPLALYVKRKHEGTHEKKRTQKLLGHVRRLSEVDDSGALLR